jgi:hypothetical protein
VALGEDLARIAEAAVGFAAPDERVTGIVATEPSEGVRVYLVSYEPASGGRTWLALDDAGRAVRERRLVREAASLAGLVEVAEESAGGGDLPELRARLAELREREAPVGIDEAEDAAAALAATLEPGPRVARTAYLDAIGAASRRLEQVLGDGSGSPFAAALQQAVPVVEELAGDVEQNYKVPLA